MGGDEGRQLTQNPRDHEVRVLPNLSHGVHTLGFAMEGAAGPGRFGDAAGGRGYFARVRAAFSAARLRPAAPLVATALRAARERSAAVRFLAAALPWRDIARGEAA